MNKSQHIRNIKNEFLTSNSTPEEVAYEYSERRLDSQANRFTRIICFLALIAAFIIIIQFDTIELYKVKIDANESIMERATIINGINHGRLRKVENEEDFSESITKAQSLKNPRFIDYYNEN